MPSAQEDEACELTDIFALGSVVYYIFHGHEPIPELDILTDEAEIRDRFRSRTFPAMEPLQAENVVKKCWRSDLRTDASVRSSLSKAYSVLPCSFLFNPRRRPVFLYPKSLSTLSDDVLRCTVLSLAVATQQTCHHQDLCRLRATAACHQQTHSMRNMSALRLLALKA